MIEQIWPKIRVLHYLLSASHGKTVAHCLDLDLVAAAAAQEEAVRRLDVLVKTQIELALTNGNSAILTTPAPLEYWKHFIEGTPVDLGRRMIEIHVPEVVPLEEEESELGILTAQLQPQYAVQ